ncbi:AraC family transcriptional regulator [Paenibacillus sp. PK3_47]|uniref:AraC family transcriptional regulator n=1 Tax=Paenibacillus sp. PK3_47 TaxID=2072642 RepID=UPI00201D2F42|nr:AraC family transcriptional regulator [Paenibacillus sp. PK3_47]
MNNRQLIVQVLDLIEAKLHTPLSVKHLSKSAGYSLYHFIRLFQGVTGLTPGEYIARRKITEAALDILRYPNRSLQDISLDFGFNDYETFARAFRRLLFTTPTSIRKNKHMDLLPLLHRLNEEDLHHWVVHIEVPPQPVELGEIILQGPSAIVHNDTSVIGMAWEKLFSNVSSIPNRRLPEHYYQLGYWPKDNGDNGTTFICACGLNPASQASSIFPVHVLPPARYLKFLHRGRSQEVSATYKYIYGVLLPRTDYRLSLPYEFEYYGPEYLGPDNENSISEIYIPLTLL